jgi:geranylgeranyl pyrophosphate synthase
LDIFGNEKEFGKKIGKDIIEKKMGNYVILSAINQLEGEDKETVQRLLSSSDAISDADIARITHLIDTTGARKDAEDTAGDFIRHAFRSLDKLPENEYRETLRDIANYIVNRES